MSDKEKTETNKKQKLYEKYDHLLTGRESEAVKLRERMKEFQKKMEVTRNVIGNNEVILMPSPSLPPLDMIPRVKLLENIEIKKLKRQNKAIKVEQTNDAALMRKKRKDFMIGVNSLCIEAISKKNPIEKSDSIA